MNLIKLSILRPVLVTMIMLALGGIGLFCYIQLPREMFPEVDFPMVTVTTIYEGAGPEEVEQLISKELEDQISTVEGIKHLRSISQQGRSLVLAEFYLEMDVDVAAADVRAKVNLVRSLLPEAAEDPVVMKFDFNAEPILQLAISAPRSLREVFQMADRRIKDRISTVPDVASVTIIGGEEREIHIITSQQRLRAYGLSITDVAMAVANANLESPGGHIKQNNMEYNIRLLGKFTDLEQIRNLTIPVRSGRSIYLREVAEILDTFKEIRTQVRADGKTCVGMTVQKRAGGNTIAVDAEIRKQIQSLLEDLPSDYDIRIIDERATWISSSIRNVFDNMFVGIVLTAIALFLFLHSLRSALIISLSMPISVLGTFIIMYLMGFTLNLMSLMGLAMTVGVLVNNAILVLENITRYLHLGLSPKEAADKGSGEIAIAVSSTTLTNVVVFVPIAFMGGIVGQFFKDFGLTATFATIVSLFISFTLTPMMASKLLTEKNTQVTGQNILHRFGRGFDASLRTLRETYSHALGWCLNHRFISLIITLLLFYGTTHLLKFIGSEFITNMDQGRFVVSVEMPVGTRIETTDETVTRIEKVLSDPKILPELVSLYTSVGSSIGVEIGGSSQGVNIAQIFVTLLDKKDRRQSTGEIIDRLRPVLGREYIPGARIKLLEASAGGGGEAPIQMELTGDNLRQINEMAQKVMQVISDPQRVPGAVDIDTNYRLGQPEIHVIPDREKCRENFIDTSYLSRVVAAIFEGLIVSEYREGAYNYDIRVKADEASREVVDDVNQLTVMNQQGSLIPLPEVAQIKYTSGPSQIFRKNRQSLITVSCALSNRSAGDVVADIMRETQSIRNEYPDVRVFFGGEVEQMQESFGRLFVALIMAIGLTYMLLASLLESFTQPLIIMISLPLSMMGVFIALFLMGGTFSIFSIMSVIMLVGLVVNNSIIIIDYINILRREGRDRFEAIIESGRTRLRPILMANLTTVVAMIPLAMGLGWGGEMRAPMAMVMIGGLIAGGWLGLLIVPVIYTLSDDFNNWIKRLCHKGD
ncbi:MAG: efflux RND transporter permease subunit [Sedimentisphaerales bacterium]|nr:efflux RND transporter permease subunit [Sedimentisphaerales bacterium]